MASGNLKAALCSVLTDYDHLDGVGRCKQAKDDVRKFMTAVMKNDSLMDIFDEFASNLIKELEKCFFSCISSDVPFRSKHMKREKIWKSFQKLRFNKLGKMWSDLFLSNEGNIPKLSPLIYQSITQKLYSELINCHIGTINDIKVASSRSEVASLTVDEENIIRYVAGYVPFKLLLQYEKNMAAEAVQVIDCLAGMAVNGDAMEYTSKWIDLVNRGGAFDVSDTTYMFFKEVELQVRKQLLLTFERNLTIEDSSQREAIVCAVVGNESVQFYWTMLSIDICEEKQAVKVLKEVVGLWVTIRGYSIAGSWLAKYSQTMSKKKALRKELKKKYTEPHTSPVTSSVTEEFELQESELQELTSDFN